VGVGGGHRPLRVQVVGQRDVDGLHLGVGEQDPRRCRDAGGSQVSRPSAGRAPRHATRLRPRHTTAPIAWRARPSSRRSWRSRRCPSELVRSRCLLSSARHTPPRRRCMTGA
jgi:hypothetical protein